MLEIVNSSHLFYEHDYHHDKIQSHAKLIGIFKKTCEVCSDVRMM